MRRQGPQSARLAAAFLTCLLVCFTPSPGWPQTPAGEAAASMPLIRSLKIVGNRAVSSQVLYNEMVTPRPPRFRRQKQPRFDPEELTADVERLQLLYRRQGFYHTKITSEVVEAAGRVDIRLRIAEGPWVRIITVLVSEVHQLNRLDFRAVLKKGPLQLGERFTEKGFYDLRKVILDYLFDHGHPKARTEGQVLLDPAANTAAVYVQVWPGPPCAFGTIAVKGQQKTPEALIRRNLKFSTGDRFSLAEILSSQERLYELDLFRSVAVTPQEVDEEQTDIPVLVDVSERKPRSLRLGAGYGSWDQFRARAVLRYRNFGGGGRILETSAKYSRLDTRFEGSFFNPMILGSGLDLVVNTGFLRRYYPSFSDKAFYTRTLLQKEFADRTKLYVGHGLEFARPFNITDLARQLLQSTSPGKLYTVNMLLWGFTRDTVDNPTNPQKGGQIFLLGELAPTVISRQLQFFQSVLEVRRYRNLGFKDVVLAGRLKFGLIPPIQDTSDIPIYRRFFSGGPNTMRAYRNYYLGPRDLSGNPLGGESTLLSNLEVRFPLYKDFKGITFLDVGNVFYKLRDTDLGQLKYGAGFGLRYQTPIGPIGVEIAWPLNPINPHKDKVQVYFNIGQAF